MVNDVGKVALREIVCFLGEGCPSGCRVSECSAFGEVVL